MFKTAKPSLDQMDAIYYYLVDEGEVCITNGPVFSDYDTKVAAGGEKAGAEPEQVSAGAYNHELQVEFFVFGEEVDGDNYVLLDRQAGSFTPAKENNRTHSLSGKPILCYAFDDYYLNRRGTKYGGYLITVTDVRGRIIDYGTSHKWLFENLENLKRLPVGKHFDKTGTRVFPPRPKGRY